VKLSKKAVISLGYHTKYLFSHWKMKIRYLKNDNDFLIFLTEMKYDSPIIEVVNNAKLHEENIMTSYNLLTQNWY